jgi:hypothetical protein
LLEMEERRFENKLLVSAFHGFRLSQWAQIFRRLYFGIKLLFIYVYPWYLLLLCFWTRHHFLR